MGTYTWDEYNELFGGPPERGDPDVAIDVREQADLARKEARESPPQRMAGDRADDQEADRQAARDGYNPAR